MTVTAKQAIKDPQLVLASGWLDGFTLNTVEPSPEAERTDGDRLILRYLPLSAGGTMTAWFEFQVNPTTAGLRAQDLELRDGARPLATLDREIRVFP